MQPPRIYNLFPRLIADLHGWAEHAARARRMNFDWFYVNPFHYPGFSGSIYAVKDYFRLDPLLLPADHPDRHYEAEIVADGGLELLGQAVGEVAGLGLRPMMDLVINHTARDGLLVEQHPEWFARDANGEIRSPSAIDPADARKVTVWGDLAEVDHAGSSDRDGLWTYLEELVRFYARLGFAGFRCDAAYHVPAELWQRLIAAARDEQPGATFFAETLGARLEQIEALRPAGLHYIFNSSKWWDYEEPWCLEQQRDHASLAPSVSFPESHDTPRLWLESGGSEIQQQQRYAFAAAFSSAVLMPVGYEFGFMRRFDVVETRSEHWEAPSTDLTPFIARTNAMKIGHPALAAEQIVKRSEPEAPIVVLEKQRGEARCWVAVNKDLENKHSLHVTAALGGKGTHVLRPCREDAADDETAGTTVPLAPGEVVYLVED